MDNRPRDKSESSSCRSTPSRSTSFIVRSSCTAGIGSGTMRPSGRIGLGIRPYCESKPFREKQIFIDDKETEPDVDAPRLPHTGAGPYHLLASLDEQTPLSVAHAP